MEIRKLTPEEYKAGDQLESLSFVQPVTEIEDERNVYHADRWGCFDDDGRLNATLTNHDLPIRFDGGIAPARGVGGVASDPVSRGQGHIRAMFERVLRDDRKEGMLFSAL
jgi:predicted acetyltransferase